MSNKKKLLILAGAIALCVLGLFLFNLKSPENSNETENPEQILPVDGNTKTITLDWSELINIEFYGVSGNPSPNIIYSEIPSLKDRILIKQKEYDENWPELAQNNNLDEINAWTEKLDRYNEISVSSVCTYDISNLSLENGDEFTFKCESQDLKDLGYEFEDNYSVKIENLPANTVNDISDNEQNYTTVEPEPEPEIVYKNYTVDELGGVWMNSNMMDEDLPEEIYNAKWKMIAVSSEEFEEAKEYALKNNIDMILLDDNIEYSIEDNFTNGEIFKGAGNDK